MAGGVAVARYDPAIVNRGDTADLLAVRRTLAALFRDRHNASRAMEGLRHQTVALIEAHWSAVIKQRRRYWLPVAHPPR